MHLLDGQQPTAPLPPRLTSGHSDIECQRVCMTARAEKMSNVGSIDLLAQEGGHIPLIISDRRGSLHRFSSITHPPQEGRTVEIFERPLRIGSFSHRLASAGHRLLPIA